MSRPDLLVATLCAALMLCMTGFMPLAAVLPELFVRFSLTETGAGWLNGAFFGGYMAGVPLLTVWTDRVDARRVMLAGLGFSAAAGLGFAFLADGLWSAVCFRMLAGAGLAGVHFPAVKLIGDRLEADAARRGQAFYVSTFSLGSGLSFLVAGAVDAWLGWRAVFAVSGAAALLGGILVAWIVAPKAPAPGAAHAVYDPRPVLGNREALRYVVAYFGHIWEMFSFRGWLVVFLGLSVALPRNAAFADWNLPVLAAITSFVSMPASIVIASMAMRHDRRRVIASTALASCVVAGLLASLGGAPSALLYAAMLVYSLTTYGDTGALATGLMAVADARARGATLALYAIVGFAGGALGSVTVGAVMELAGGRHAPGAWVAAWITIGLGSALTALAMAVRTRRVGV